MESDFYCYRCKSGLIPGHNYVTIVKIARRIFNDAVGKTKRRPYIRSAYFKGEKIFLDNFWPHLIQKNPKDRFRRLQLLKAGLELLRCSKREPIFAQRNELGHEAFYRFLGKVAGQFFVVQIKEDLKRRQKFFMSAFGYTEK